MLHRRHEILCGKPRDRHRVKALCLGLHDQLKPIKRSELTFSMARQSANNSLVDTRPTIKCRRKTYWRVSPGELLATGLIWKYRNSLFPDGAL
jgi:hypothetical protein